MNIIFLGKQGVLNSFDYEKKVQDMYHKNGRLKVNIDSQNIKVLKRMIELTDAKIVLISEWNTDFDKELNPFNANAKKIKKLFEKEKVEIHDIIENDFSTQDVEIKNWLNKHKNNKKDTIENFVILSDKSEIGKYKSKLIQTDYGDGGLREGHICILKHKMKPKEEATSKTKIERALDQIEKPNNQSFLRIKNFSIENMEEYFQYFDWKAKSLLTVGSSSDSVFNAFYLGCRDITLLDLNPYIEEYFELKKSAIQTLTYDEFLNFLSFKGKIFSNTEAFNEEVFKRVVENIEKKEIKEFWKNLLEFSTPKKIKKNLFTSHYPKKLLIKRFNNYLKEEESYELLKGKIKNLKVTFINADIYHYQLTKSYDNILLSNICRYYQPDDTLDLYEKLKEHLNENGQLLEAYLPSYGEKEINGEKILENTTIKTIAGVKANDSVILYKKNK